MKEIILNLHMHTCYSDGSGNHRDLARAALRQGIDAILVTDHNVRIGTMQRYYEEGGKRVLILSGEELHDRNRLPQKNHLLVFGVDRELAPFTHDLDVLLALVRRAGGVSFLAHPVDPAAPTFHEPDISWEAVPRSGFTGVELWNGFSELKGHLPTRLHGILYAFFPVLMAHGPLPGAVQLWDHLLTERRIVAVGGSDAHALKMRLGPVARTVFPYDYHFRAVNTHVLLEEPLCGNARSDSSAICSALAAGRCFIGYDLPGSTRGFRFTARGDRGEAAMGGSLPATGGATLHIWAPHDCELRILRDGMEIAAPQRVQALTRRIVEPGVYRVEAYRRYWGRPRAWIISNPIYVQ